MPAPAQSQVLVQAADPQAYGVPWQEGSIPWLSARMDVAKQFYATHGDFYDFLIVFPTFPIDLGDASGREIGVSNDVRGIGRPQSSVAVQFGSRGRLKGYVDSKSLMEGASFDATLSLVAHEVAHAWSGAVSFRDPSGVTRSDLIGKDGAHWSFYLDSDASVLYGSRWQAEAGGQFTALESMRRYSPLDLYLAGFLAPEEVQSFNLIRPAPGEPHLARELPPPDGTTVKGNAERISIDQIIAAEGARFPAASSSQAIYRAAFLVLSAPGQTPTPEQLALVDQVRRAWANQFFFMTRGRGVMETDLVETSGRSMATNPSVSSGLAYLLSAQRQDGAWSDDVGTAVRDTQAVEEALALFPGSATVLAAAERGADYLVATTPTDTDQSARRALALVAAKRTIAPMGDQPFAGPLREDGGLGLAPGYGSTIVDSVLAALARQASGQGQADLDLLADYLLRVQNGDGGWPFIAGGPSQVEPTAWVLRFLGALQRDELRKIAANAGLVYLESHRQLDGRCADDLARASYTAEAFLAYDAWGLTWAPDKDVAAAILSDQLDDGSWEQSVYQTAMALRALRGFLTPNMVVSPADVRLSSARVNDGESVLLAVTIRNTGHGDVANVAVRAFDSNGLPFGPPVTIPKLTTRGSASLSLLVDTTGHAGSSQIFLVVDPDGIIEETRKDDNRVAQPLEVAPPPSLPDPFVVAGSVEPSPPSIDRYPATVVVRAVLGNTGQADAVTDVAVLARGSVLATASVTIPARTRQPFELQVGVPEGAFADIPIAVQVDPQARLAQASTANDVAYGLLRVIPTIDLAVRDVAVAPQVVSQGETVRIAYSIANSGTLDLPGVLPILRIVDAAGTTVVPLGAAALAVPAGGVARGEVSWKASAIGALLARVEAPEPRDPNPADNAGSAAFVVQPSALPNLAFEASSLRVDPNPAKQGQMAKVVVQLFNSGSVAAANFAVDLFLGDPKNGALLGRQQLASIDPAQRSAVEFGFVVDGSSDLGLVVVADPGNSVQEYDESDNTVATTVPVLPRADLALTEGAISVQAAEVREGATVPVSVLVVNVGGQPSEPTVVDLYAGAPEAGGQLISSIPLPVVAGGDSMQLVASWGPVDPRVSKLVAVANPAHSAFEARFDNNRAEKSVAMAGGAVTASNPFFSPNGDGLKDTTTITLGDANTTGLRVTISDFKGNVVRQLAPPSGSVEVVWDGRSDAGALLRDGAYRAVAFGPSAGGDSIGQVDLVVDTNRSRLEEVAGTDLIEVAPLIDHARSPDLRGMLAIPDGTGVIAYGYDGKTAQNGSAWFLLQPGGGFPVFVTDGGGMWPFFRRPIRTPSASSNGRFVAFATYDTYCDGGEAARSWGQDNRGACTTLDLVDTAERRAVELARHQPDLPLWDQPQPSPSGVSIEAPVAVSPDGTMVAFVSSTVACTGAYGSRDCRRTYTLETIGADGSGRRVLAPLGEFAGSLLGTHLPIASMAFSPDGSRIVALGADWLAVTLTTFDAATGAERQTVPEVQYLRPWQWLGSSGELVGMGLDGNLVAVGIDTGSTRPLLQLDPVMGLPAGFAISPFEDAVALKYGYGDYYVAPLESQAPTFLASGGYGNDLAWGQGATGLFIGSLDQEVRSLANMTARLSVTRDPGSPVARFSGTAADLNIESWEVRVKGTGFAERVIARGTANVLRGTFVEWVPPGDQAFEAALVVTDKAGNRVERWVKFGWGNAAVISNVAVAPEYISPNADGVQDAATVSYSASGPATLQATVARADGTIVRQIAKTQVEGGDFATAWDGSDDAGRLVPDGEYHVAVGTQRFRVVVDTVKPTVDFAFSDRLGASATTWFRYLKTLTLTVDCNRQPLVYPPGAEQPEMQVWESSLARDENLLTWALERGPAATPTVVATGTEQTEVSLSIPLVLAAGGPYRLRATDRAGNSASTVDQTVPEGLFALSVDSPAVEGAACSTGNTRAGAQSGFQVGQSVYRTVPWGLYGAVAADERDLSHFVIPPDPATGAPLPIEQERAMVTGQVLIELAESIGQPVVQWSVEHRLRGSGEPFSVDYLVREVPGLGLLWTTPPALMENWEARVRALDASGRLFLSQVFHLVSSSSAKPPDGIDACLTTAPEEVLEVSAAGLRAPYVDVSFTAEGAPTAAKVMKLEPPAGSAQVDLSQITLATGDLPGCRYLLSLSGRDLDGVPFKLQRWVRLCGSWIERSEVAGTSAWLTIGERFRQGVVDEEIRVSSPAGGAIVAGSTGSFDGFSPPTFVDLSAAQRCADAGIKLVARLADGTTDDTMAMDASRPTGEFALCGKTPSVVRTACTRAELRLARADAPDCQANVPQYTASIDLVGDVGISAVDLAIERPSGAPVRAVAVYGVTQGTTVHATSTFDAAGLAEGEYRVVARATDVSGGVTRVDQPLLVDSTPPTISLRSPLAGSRLCVGPGQVVAVTGRIADATLERYDVVLRAPGVERRWTRSPVPTVVDGILAEMDVSGLPSGSASLLVAARDASGGSFCAPEVTFQMDASVSLDGVPQQLAAFSPDGDGILEQVAIPFQIDEPAQVAGSAVGADGAVQAFANVAAPGGGSSVVWNGRMPDGSPAPDGTYELTLEARDGCGNQAKARSRVDVDTTPPIARIDSPSPGEAIAGDVILLGRVADAHLSRYAVEIGAGPAPASFEWVGEWTTPADAKLATIPMIGRPTGDYTVRLVADDAVGHRTVREVIFARAAGQLLAGYSIEPTAVSPNGDGVQDGAVAAVQLAGAATVTLQVLDGSGAPTAIIGGPAILSAGSSVLALDPVVLGAMPDGRHQVVAIATDGTTTESGVGTVLVDRVAPTIEMQVPAPESVRASPLTVAIRVDDGALTRWSATIREQGGTERPVSAGVQPISGAIGTLDLADGTYELRVQAEDAAGNKSDRSARFVVDSTKPLVKLTAPPSGAILTGANGATPVLGAVQDPSLSSWRLELGRDGSSRTVGSGTVGVDGVLTSLDLGAEPDGDAVLTLTGTDRAGNVATASLDVTIDNTRPQALLAAPRETFVVAGVRVTGVAADDRLASWMLDLAAGPSATASQFVPLSQGTTPVLGGSFAEIASRPADGEYTLRLTVIDQAGNRSTDTAGFSVDSVPPGPPSGLAVVRQAPRDAVLTWSPAADPDVAGYRVYRALGSAVLVPIAGLVADPTFTDPALADGTYRYVVMAVDRAGNESKPCPERQLRIDTTPPTVRIASPGDGTAAGGRVQVIGTALAEDLASWRLSVGEGAAPGQTKLLAASVTYVVNGQLGVLDASALPHGSLQTLVLEAEDLSGNVAEARVTILIDNLAPSAPVLLYATPQADGIAVGWQASSETDLLGYALMRDGVPVGTAPGVDLTDPRDFLLAATKTTYDDVPLPDGTYTYWLEAYDGALNPSPPSNAITCTLDRRAPDVAIVRPANLDRLSGPTEVEATVVDADVTSVRIEARAAGASSFTTLLQRTSGPYVVALNPADFPSPFIEVRAVAVDAGGRSTTNPPTLLLIASRPPIAPVVQARVDQSDVRLTWVDPNPPGAVFAYAVERDGTSLLPGPTITGTATATSSLTTGKASNGFDGNPSTYWQPSSPLPQSWEVLLDAPALVGGIDVQLATAATFDVEGRVGGTWVPLVKNVIGQVGYNGVGLQSLGLDGVRLSFTAASGAVRLADVTVYPWPATTTASSMSDLALADGAYGYRVTAFNALGDFTDGTAAGLIYAPYIDTGNIQTFARHQMITGGNATPLSTVSVLVNGAVAASTIADSSGFFAADLPVQPGDSAVTAQATDPDGNRSRLSDPIVVTGLQAPIIDLALSLEGVDQGRVSLAIAASGDVASLAAIEIRREAFGGSVVAGTVGPADRAFTDGGLPAGSYVYVAVPIDLNGNVGAPSNAVTASVSGAQPIAPSGLAVSGSGSSVALELSWSYSGPSEDTFLVERRAGTGPFEEITPPVPPTARYRRDSLLNPGVTYTYRVRAVDRDGNVSEPSNEASGALVAAAAAVGAPVIKAPTRAGSPIRVEAQRAVVAGTAPAGARVDLRDNGRAAGSGLADRFVPDATTFLTAHPVLGPMDVNQGGDLVAYTFSTAAGGRAIAVEEVGSGIARAVYEVASGDVLDVALAPNGLDVAISSCSGTGCAIEVGDAATGAFSPLQATYLGDSSSPAWSPDGRSLAYVAIRGGSAFVAVTERGSGVERLIAPSAIWPGMGTGASWVGNHTVAAAVARNDGTAALARVDAVTGAAADFVDLGFEWVHWWTVAPLAGRAAVSVGDWSSPRVWAGGWLGDVARAFDGLGGRIAISPTGEQLAAVDYGGIALVELATGRIERAALPPGVTPHSQLIWSARGLLASDTWAGGAYEVRLDHGFEIPVNLDPGRNLISAVAVDPSGQTSDYSEAIDVTWDTSALPDLSVSAAVQPAVPTAEDAVNLLVTVRNGGASGTGGSTVSASLRSPDGATVALGPFAVRALNAGEAVVLMVPVDTKGASGRFAATIAVALDEGLERDLSNNSTTATFDVLGAGSPTVALLLEPSAILPAQVSTARITLANPGPVRSATLRMKVVDGGGVLVQALPDEVVQLSGAGVLSLARQVALSGFLAGDYLVVTELVDGGTVVSTASAALSLLAETVVGVTLTPERAYWYSDEEIRVEALVTNLSADAPLSGASLSATVVDAMGAVAWTGIATPVPYLWMGGSSVFGSSLAPHSLLPGTYTFRGEVAVGAQSAAIAVAPLTVLGRPSLHGRLELIGASQTEPPAVRAGADLTVRAILTNDGDEPARGVVARLTTVDASTALASSEVALGDIGPRESTAFSVAIPTASFPLGVFGLALTGTSDGTTQPLATGRFRIADGVAPSLAFVNLEDGSFVRESVAVRVQAADDATGVAAVTAVAAGAASPLALVSGSPIYGIWGADIALPYDGSHTLLVSARDGEGNDGALSPGPLNPIAITIVRDTVPPELSISGVNEGALVNHAVAATISATDLHLAGVDAWLDEAPYQSGAAITLDGPHLVSATATDRAGNLSTARLTFTIDQTPPSIAVLGVGGGGAYKATDVLPQIEVRDLHLESYSASLGGAPFVEGTVLSAERTYLLVVDARDLAGNVAREEVSFTIDKTAPEITISGVSEGAWLSRPAVPDVAFSDANLASADVAIDGVAWLAGTPVAAEGEHLLTARAIDKAGNRSERSVRFFVDTTPPAISITGVSEGDMLNHPVTPIVTVTETNLSSSETRIDGVVTLPGASVSAEGTHVVEATAVDLAGGAATARLSFEIDTTPPAISASVENGATYSSPLSIAFSADDLHLLDVQATLDGQPFSSGSAVDAGGAHLLLVTARDLAGNSSERRIEFTVGDDLRADLSKERIVRSSNVLAWLSDGCGTTGARIDAMRAFIAGAVPAGTVVEFPATVQEFRRLLRTGEFGVFVLAAAEKAPDGENGDEPDDGSDRDHDHDHDDHGHVQAGGDREAAEACRHAHPDGEGVGRDEPEDDHRHERSCPRLDSLTQRELREAIFRGGGLIVMKRTPSELPEMREPLGVHFEGYRHAEVVRFVQSAFTEPGLLAVRGGVELELEGSAATGWFGDDDDHDDVAVSAHRFGLGEALVFGFDLSAALPREVASATFGSAVSFAAGEADLLPAGVVGVEIRVQNRGGAAPYRVVETLDPALQVARVLDSGTAGAGSIEWKGQLEVGEMDALRYFVRLPSAAGTWQTRSALYLGTGAKPAAGAALALVLAGDGATLLASAEGAVRRLPTARADDHRRHKLLAMLGEVAANPGATLEDRERAIETLLDAASLASKIETADPTEARVAIDRLLAWWEMMP